MDKQPATKRQRILSGPLDKGLESLANALRALYHRVDNLIQCQAELPLDLSDVESLQAHLIKFGKKLDKLNKPVPRLKCPQCPNKRFNRQDRLFAHCEAYHPGREYLNLSCPCPRSFKYLRQRNEHLKSDHLEKYEMERLLIEEGVLCSNVILSLQLSFHVKTDPAVPSFGRSQYDYSPKEEARMEPCDTGGRELITLGDNIGTFPLYYARPSSSDAKADTAGEKPEGASGIWDFKQSRSPGLYYTELD